MKLPGIKNIAQVNASDLSFVLKSIFAPDSIVFPVAPWQNICLVGLAECTDESRIELGQELHEVILTYFTEKEPTTENVPLSFLLKTVTGEVYLLGTDKKPHPQRIKKNIIPGSTTGKTGWSVSITYKNTFGLLAVKY